MKIKVVKGVVVNLQEFQQTLALYIAVMAKCASVLIQKQARLFCDDMLDYTPPTISMSKGGGKGLAAQKKGMGIVDTQIRGLFTPLAYVKSPEIYAHGNEAIFYAWVRLRRENNDSTLPKWLNEDPYGSEGSKMWKRFKKWKYAKEGHNSVSVDFSQYYKGDLKSVHEQNRGGNKTPTYFDAMGKNSKFVKYAVDKAALDKYSEQVQKRVGELKAAWYGAGSQLGSISAPMWIKGNQWGQEILINQLSDKSMPAVTVGNKSQGLHIETMYDYKIAMNHRAYSMRVEMLEKLIKNGMANKIFHLAPKNPGFTISEE